MRSCCVLVALLVVACAKAGAPDVQGQVDSGVGGQNPDAAHGFQRPDANPNIDAARPIDAAPIPDAPPGMATVTLSQTQDTVVAANDSITCATQQDGSRPATFYRVFDLAAAGINTTFNVSEVSFAVEDCFTAGGDGITVTAGVGTYGSTPPNTAGGKLDPAQINITATNTGVTVPEVDEGTDPPQTVNAAIAAAIPGGSQLVFEVVVGDGFPDEFYFYPGASKGGQSALGFFSSTSCSPPGTNPTDIQSIVSGATNIGLIMTVTGTYQL